jgi:hypothetical protein
MRSGCHLKQRSKLLPLPLLLLLLPGMYAVASISVADAARAAAVQHATNGGIAGLETCIVGQPQRSAAQHQEVR